MNYKRIVLLAVLLGGIILPTHAQPAPEGRTTDLGWWKSHTNLTHPGKYFRPSKVKIMRPTSPK